MLGFAKDRNFFGHREGDAVLARAERLDFCGTARLLPAEVVAGHAKYREAFVFVLVKKGLEPGVLRGVTAFGGDVDDEGDLTFAGSKDTFFAINVLEGDFVN